MSAISRMGIAILAMVFCTTVGLIEIAAVSIGLGILTISLGATNLLPLWIGWKQYKQERISS